MANQQSLVILIDLYASFFPYHAPLNVNNRVTVVYRHQQQGLNANQKRYKIQPNFFSVVRAKIPTNLFLCSFVEDLGRLRNIDSSQSIRAQKADVIFYPWGLRLTLQLINEQPSKSQKNVHENRDALTFLGGSSRLWRLKTF